MKDINLVETISSIKSNLSCHYSDAAELDFIIKELKTKRDRIVKRLDRDCRLLESIVKDEDITKLLSDSFISDLNESIEFTKQFVLENLK